MKQILRHIFLLVAILVATANAWAECYVLNEQAEPHTIKIYESKSYNISGPCATLSFQARRGIGIEGLEIYEYVNEDRKYITKIKNGDLKTSFKTFSCNLSRNATKIEFYNTGGIWKEIKDVKITQASYVDAPTPSSLTFDTKMVGSSEQEKTFTISWSDVNPFTFSLSGSDQFSYSFDTNTNAQTCSYGTMSIFVTYKYTSACPIVNGQVQPHTATLTVTTSKGAHKISLTGTTLKKNQTISWSPDFKDDMVSLPTGKEIISPATVNSGLPLTYTSSNEDILAVEGTILKALKAGEVTLTVEQAGNDEWNPISATKTIKVTEKTIQYIHWIDNLTRLVVGGEPVQLTATAQILLNAETDETQDAPERTALITYQSANDNVVTINGTTLTIVGEGETTVTANLPGDDTYEATSISMPVRVRVPSTTCDSYVLEATDEFSIEYSLFGQERIYEPDAFTGPGYILTFEARKNNSTAVGNIQIQQYVNGEWKDIDDANPDTDWRSYYYELDRNATKIRFYNGYGSYRRYFKNVLVTQATYLETTTPEITVEKSIVGDEIRRDILVQYSNIPAGAVVSNKSALVRLSDDEIDTDCGTYGEKQITLTCNPVAVGTINDTITIYEEVSGFTLTIPVAIHTQRNTQTIIWEDSVENILATDVVTFTATAENAITYTSSDSAIAYVSETNQLLIQSAGKVTITAYAAESETYESAQVSKEIVISKATPVITELPTVDPFGYGQTLEMIVLEGGTADVEGTFVWNADLTQILNAGTHEVAITFVPTVNTIYNAVDTIVTVQVDPIAQTIEWNAKDTTITVSEVIYLSELCDAVATSGLAIQYIYSEDWANFVTYNEVTDEVTGIKEGVIIITATQDGMDNGYQNYLVAEPVSRKLTIVAEGGTSTNVDNIQSGNLSTYKKIINGQIVIIRGEQMYDIQGRVIR